MPEHRRTHAVGLWSQEQLLQMNDAFVARVTAALALERAAEAKPETTGFVAR